MGVMKYTAKSIHGFQYEGQFHQVLKQNSEVPVSISVLVYVRSHCEYKQACICKICAWDMC
jgi:hypothetical protein